LYKRQQEKVWKPDEKKTALTEDRIDALNSIDFIWDIQQAQFELFLVAYRKFQEENGNGSVPKKYKDGLGRWVGSQRSTLRKGKMPLDRFLKLERVGFLWTSHRDPSGELMVQLEKMKGKAKLASGNALFKKRA
jgi:Helicase associated domain